MPDSSVLFGASQTEGPDPCSAKCRAIYSPSLVKTSTLTIRLSMEHRRALRRSAKGLRKTESEFIRDLIARDLDVRTLGERGGTSGGVARFR